MEEIIDLEEVKSWLREAAGFTNGQSLDKVITYLVRYEPYIPLSRKDRTDSKPGIEFQAAITSLEEDGVGLDQRRAILDARDEIIDELGGIENYLQALELIRGGHEDEATGE